MCYRSAVTTSPSNLPAVSIRSEHERALELLQGSYAEGQIAVEELEQRMERGTRRELVGGDKAGGRGPRASTAGDRYDDCTAAGERSARE